MSRTKTNYVYVILCGARRDLILGTFTVKHKAAEAVGNLRDSRSDLMVRRHRDGEIGMGTILNIDDLLEEAWSW